MADAMSCLFGGEEADMALASHGQSSVGAAELPPESAPAKSSGSWLRANEAQVRGMLGQARDEVLKVRLKDLLGLAVGTTDGDDLPATSWLVGSLFVRGEARRDAVHLRASVRVTVLSSEWTCVPLFPVSAAVTSSVVSKSEPASHFGVVGDAHSFVSRTPGEHEIEVELLVPYATARKTGFHVSVPRAAKCDLEFSVPVAGVQIRAEPSLFSETAGGSADSTTVHCKVPPTGSINVQWTEKFGVGDPQVKAAEPAKKKTLEKVVASAEQLSLTSIGDGYLAVCTQLLFTVASGQMSVFVVEVDPRVRIVSVEGLPNFPVKHWEVQKLLTASSFADPETPDAERPKAQVLRAILEYGLEDNFELTIVSEMQIEATTTKLRVPNFRVLPDCDAHHITRERGYVAVEVRTNVEIRDAGSKLLGRSDVSELPEKLWDAFTSSPLLCYKFIEPTWTLHLALQKHQDAQVLVAVVTAAHVACTVTSEGKLLYVMLLHMRNTQRQFVRISAKGTALWSASVAGVPVKPAVDSSGNVLMPLTTSSGASSDGSSRLTLVKYACLRELPPLAGTGRLKIDLPGIDVPISKLMVSIYMPDTGFRFGEFETSLREVKSFSDAGIGLSTNSGPLSSNSRTFARASGRGARQMARRESTNVCRPPPPPGTAEPVAYDAGVTSVDVSLPTTNVVARFEQLLVMPAEECLSIEVPYARVPKGSCHCCS